MYDGMVDFLATPSELALLEDFDDIGFGELYQVKFVEGNRKPVRIDQKIKDALLALRVIGQANRVIIHESRPTMIEYRTRAQSTGLRCLKKMKF